MVKNKSCKQYSWIG